MSKWKPKPAYHSINWSDFHSSTMTMSNDGAHAYLFLLGRAWEDGGYLRDDDDFLRRAARMEIRRWNRCKEEVKSRFERDQHGRLFQPRLLTELDKIRTIRENLKRNSDSRWSKKSNKINDSGHANGMQKICNTVYLESESDTSFRILNSESENHSRESAIAPSDDVAPPPDFAAEAFKIWIEILGDLHRPKRLDPDRRKRLRSALIGTFDGDLDRWREHCQTIRSSEFLTGGNDRGWTVTLDWSLKPANLRKIVEGQYSNRTARIATNGQGKFSITEAAAESLRRLKARQAEQSSDRHGAGDQSAMDERSGHDGGTLFSPDGQVIRLSYR